jgi:TonB family protein
MRRELLSGLMVFVGVLAYGQNAPLGLTETRPTSLAPAVKDAPYSAELNRVVTYPGRNGAPGRDTRQATKVFRDSRGRIRFESLLIPGPGGGRLLITLTDAAAGRECYLNSDDKVAHCFSPIPVAVPTPPSGVSEDLGTKTVEGVRVEGKRFTAPGGVVEMWTSPELQINLNTSMNMSSIQNNMTTRDLRREEPDASLFEVPADFQIVDETGDRALIFGPAPVPVPARDLPVGVYRPGNGVSMPKLVKKVEPRYTEEARRNKVEGRVTLSMVVAVNGRATDFLVMGSLDAGLDQEAIKAVKEWRFEPGQKDGKPVPILATIEVNFRLLDKPPSK